VVPVEQEGVLHSELEVVAGTLEVVVGHLPEVEVVQVIVVHSVYHLPLP